MDALSPTNWIEAINYWRSLSPEEQRRRALSQLARKVARSMAFAGEPVDQAILEDELNRLMGLGTSTTRSQF